MIFNAPNTKRNRIAALIAIALGLGVGFYVTVSGKGNSDTPEKITLPPTPTASETVSPPTPPQTLPAGRLEDIDFNAYSQDLAEPFGLVMGETRLDSIDKIRLYFAPEPGVNMVNMTSSTFERDDGSVMLFARNNLPDDAVFAQEIYAVFSGPGDAQKFNQKLAAYGLRLKCRRGDNAMEWTTELCP
ncbi:MAG: hypothetical protein ABJN22_05570 [Litorimonas sp.]